jgi:Uma2 family endonuclease
MSMPAYAPPPDPGRWTVEMLDTMPADGNRYEIIDGDLYVTPAPSPTHQRACAELYKALWPYIDLHGVGELFFSPIDVEFAPDTMVEPDLVLFPPPAGKLPPRFRGSDGALLAIEVLSPSTARSDRQKKRALYQRERVPEYWIVDLDARIVERWRPTDARPEILVEALTWLPSGASEPFVMKLAEYFARVWGE